MAFFNFRLFKILVNKKEHSRHFAYSKIHTYIFLFPILGPKLRVFLITGYITQSSLPINYTRDLCPYFLCYLSDRNNYVFRTNSWAAKPAKPAKLARKSRKLKVELSNCFNHNKKDQIYWISNNYSRSSNDEFVFVSTYDFILDEQDKMSTLLVSKKIIMTRVCYL